MEAGGSIKNADRRTNILRARSEITEETAIG
jgi:hypothetical protein